MNIQNTTRPYEHFGVCGGCKWQNMKYSQQLYYQNEVLNHLQRIGKVELLILSQS
jgi:23S rRNA (uracil1939-C5)-methyltransferase